MNVFMGEKLVLTQPVDKLRTIGATYEIANIVDNFVVLRDAKTKVAIGTCNIIDLEKHFTKVNEFKGWTQWARLLNARGDVVAFYRTNYKKVQIKSVDNFRGEATCNKCDVFDLWFGINLAYTRMQNKVIAKVKADCADILERCNRDEHENKNTMKRMLNSLDKVVDDN